MDEKRRAAFADAEATYLRLDLSEDLYNEIERAWPDQSAVELLSKNTTLSKRDARKLLRAVYDGI